MLKLENVSKVYHGKSHISSSDDNNDSRLFLEHVVLNNLNLSIGEGEFITIVGRSGCGKILQIHRRTNKTIPFVTHNINEAVALGDRVIVMSPLLANI